MRLILLLTFCFILLNCNNFIGAQTRGYSKNSIGIEYTSALTKTFFDESIESRFLGTSIIRETYHSKKPTAPVLGYDLGVSYSRNISKNLALYIKLRHTVKGQKSPHFYNYFDREPSDYNSNYGGLSYNFKVITNELVIGGTKQYFNKGKANLLLGLGIIVSVYNDAKFHDYLIERENGIYTVGCCAVGFYASNLSYFGRLKENIKLKHFRYGLILHNEFQYEILKSLIGTLGVDIAVLSKITGNSKQKRSLVLQGQFLSAGLSLGTKWRF